ncbi:hypothetical protein H6A02_01670 [Veillonella magna]|uniref:hypothetical protein n=1 Tax=Veillonella magna TaxID=464322 RepID=UPI001961E301|nr:hypothetical protein [Veillonella magna]MBM6823694.1 hypothetical protein [Veillonella magna]
MERLKSVLPYVLMWSGWLLCIGGVGTMDIDPSVDITRPLIVILVGLALLVSSYSVEALLSRTITFKVNMEAQKNEKK